MSALFPYSPYSPYARDLLQYPHKYSRYVSFLVVDPKYGNRTKYSVSVHQLNRYLPGIHDFHESRFVLNLRRFLKASPMHSYRLVTTDDMYRAMCYLLSCLQTNADAAGTNIEVSDYLEELFNEDCALPEPLPYRYPRTLNAFLCFADIAFVCRSIHLGNALHHFFTKFAPDIVDDFPPALVEWGLGILQGIVTQDKLFMCLRELPVDRILDCIAYRSDPRWPVELAEDLYYGLAQLMRRDEQDGIFDYPTRPRYKRVGGHRLRKRLPAPPPPPLPMIDAVSHGSPVSTLEVGFPARSWNPVVRRPLRRYKGLRGGASRVERQLRYIRAELHNGLSGLRDEVHEHLGDRFVDPAMSSYPLYPRYSYSSLWYDPDSDSEDPFDRLY